MNNNTPESKPNIALYIVIAVVIALLVGIGVGVGVSNYQKSKPKSTVAKSEIPVAKPQAALAKPSARDPNVVYSIVKEPENTDPIEITCDFNIKDYVANPYGFKYPSLSGALQWVHTHIKGGLERERGIKLSGFIDRGHWQVTKSTQSQLMKVYRIGKDHTNEAKYYLVLFKSPEGYTFIEIPDQIAARIKILPKSLSPMSLTCLPEN